MMAKFEDKGGVILRHPRWLLSNGNCRQISLQRGLIYSHCLPSGVRPKNYIYKLPDSSKYDITTCHSDTTMQTDSDFFSFWLHLTMKYHGI